MWPIVNCSCEICVSWHWCVTLVFSCCPDVWHVALTFMANCLHHGHVCYWTDFFTDVVCCQLQQWSLCLLTLQCHPVAQLLPSCWNVALIVNCLPHGHVALTLNVILSVDMSPSSDWNVALTKGQLNISQLPQRVYHVCCHTLNYDIGLLLLLPLIKKPFPEYVNHPQPCNHTHYMRL